MVQDSRKLNVFSILKGPSRWDFMLSQFDNQERPIRLLIRPFSHIPISEELKKEFKNHDASDEKYWVEVVITGSDRGFSRSGCYWFSFRGLLIKPKITGRRKVEGELSLLTREGNLNIESECRQF